MYIDLTRIYDYLIKCYHMKSMKKKKVGAWLLILVGFGQSIWLSDMIWKVRKIWYLIIDLFCLTRKQIILYLFIFCLINCLPRFVGLKNKYFIMQDCKFQF